MGQNQSLTDSLPDVDSVHMQVVRHTKVLSEINSLTYEDFKTCLDNLNTLSRKCIDPNGKQLVFLIKRGTDTSLLWKATVKIACIKVDPQTRQIHSYKFLNLKQFLCVFKTFQSHLESLVRSENQRDIRRGSQSTPEDEEHSNNLDMTTNLPQQFTASMFMSALGSSTDSGSGLSSPTTSTCSHNDHVDECSICLDRSTEVILPCTHSFCTPCIEQWNVNNKTCPICCETLESTDDTWVMSNIPGVEEINEEICAEFMNLAAKEQ
ncbi:RING finger protein 141-like [Lucilia cuprina]|uniref:RING finger protein 141-like n=1 Tax=Lucilia cuprina TaxID=7375 RepID=UPI0018A840D5|nr:RING finger protein 141-like [Lucilia cuprina]XP_037814108.1 RING finger protein 141-like [Lucilia sericata]